MGRVNIDKQYAHEVGSSMQGWTWMVINSLNGDRMIII